MEKQQDLFSEQSTPQLTADEAAAHIAEHARPVEYPDRTNEAARDQGWGPVDVARPTEPATKPAKLYEMPGQNRGRNNPHNEPLSRKEILDGLSSEEIERRAVINRAGAATARAALR